MVKYQARGCTASVLQGWDLNQELCDIQAVFVTSALFYISLVSARAASTCTVGSDKKLATPLGRTKRTGVLQTHSSPARATSLTE